MWPGPGSETLCGQSSSAPQASFLRVAVGEEVGPDAAIGPGNHCHPSPGREALRLRSSRAATSLTRGVSLGPPWVSSLLAPPGSPASDLWCPQCREAGSRARARGRAACGQAGRGGRPSLTAWSSSLGLCGYSRSPCTYCLPSELVWPEGSHPSASSTSPSSLRTAGRGLRQEESQGLELAESPSRRGESGMGQNLARRFPAGGRAQ